MATPARSDDKRRSGRFPCVSQNRADFYQRSRRIQNRKRRANRLKPLMRARLTPPDSKTRRRQLIRSLCREGADYRSAALSRSTDLATASNLPSAPLMADQEPSSRFPPSRFRNLSRDHAEPIAPRRSTLWTGWVRLGSAARYRAFSQPPPLCNRCSTGMAEALAVSRPGVTINDASVGKRPVRPPPYMRSSDRPDTARAAQATLHAFSKGKQKVSCHNVSSTRSRSAGYHDAAHTRHQRS